MLVYVIGQKVTPPQKKKKQKQKQKQKKTKKVDEDRV